MRETKLIDMSGLSGDPSNDDLLDDLLLRLESDTPNVPHKNSKHIYLPSCTTMERLTRISVKRAAGKIGMITRRMTKSVACSATPGRATQ